MGKLIGLIVILFIFVGALALLAKILGQRKAPRPEAGPEPSAARPPLRYIPQGRIMSENEAAFLRVLRSTFGDTYLIFAQLPLSRIISPAKGDRSASTAAANRIDRKTVDFVLVHPETMAVVKVIELNDSSHNRRDRQERDNFVREALKQADVPFVEVRAAGSYSAASLGPLLAGAGTG